MKRLAPYGTWDSPIDVAAAVDERPIGRGRFGAVDGRPGVWFTQAVPEQCGAPALFWAPRDDTAARVQITGLDISVTSRVNEYGGGAWAILPTSGRLVFVENDSQRICTLSADQIAQIVRAGGRGLDAVRSAGARGPIFDRIHLTPDTDGAVRYGDLTVSQGVVLAVQETHTPVPQTQEPQTTEPHKPEPHSPETPGDRVTQHDRVTQALVVLARDEDDESGAADDAPLSDTLPAPQILAEAPADFLAWPRLSPDRTLLAWVGWDSPHMPWGETGLFATALDPGTLEPVGDAHRIWHSPEVSVLQPEWLSGKDLAFSEDSSGHWTVVTVDAPSAYRRACGEPGVPPAESTVRVRPAVREFREKQFVSDPPASVMGESVTLTGEIGGPLWKLGSQWYLPVSRGTRILAESRSAGTTLLWADPRTGAEHELGCPLDWLRIQDFDDDSATALLVGGAGDRVTGLYTFHVASGELHPVALEADVTDTSPWFSTPQLWSFDAVHTVVYPPFNPQTEGPDDERPPYVVFVHGGPTDQAMPSAQSFGAFFTSRGIGVALVNHTGSTGFGRHHRSALHGRWGIDDVDDVVTVARGLAAAGLADRDRIAVSGSSAGGWTVLGAVTASDVFACGVSRYGVADALDFARGTARFEAHYSQSLIGPLPGSEDLHHQRSPLSRADRLTVPLALFQGQCDTVVLPSQTQRVIDALEENGTPYAARFYEDEGHGFTTHEVIADTLVTEFGFYAKIMGFTPHGLPSTRLQGRGR